MRIAYARAYAARHRLLLVERLGFGIHGSVHVVEDKIKVDVSPNNIAFLD